jgi:hypothetical protein
MFLKIPPNMEILKDKNYLPETLEEKIFKYLKYLTHENKQLKEEIAKQKIRISLLEYKLEL